MARRIASAFGPELFFGLVGAIGADLGLVSEVLQNSLHEVNYSCQEIKFSSLLTEIDKPGHIFESEADRYNSLMTAGDKFRTTVDRADALAILAISEIQKYRETESKHEEVDTPAPPLPRKAYILRQFKRREEVQSLRNIYGTAFVLVAAYSPRPERVRSLARKIAKSHNKIDPTAYLSEAESLVARDENEANEPFGQRLRETFPLADVFVSTDDRDRLRVGVSRFVELIFGHLFHSPTRDEYGMFHARAAALRSAALGRQVGAVIATLEGDIIAVGTNEVPKAGGGLYWVDDPADNRDFKMGEDSNDTIKRTVLAELLHTLQSEKWFEKRRAAKIVEELCEEAMQSGIVKQTRLMSLIEFGRPVHAEMAAIVDASRRGVSVHKSVLYTTTFPCHECARHIVAAGIGRVVYIEPYPKSLALQLHPDSITLDERDACGDKVRFESFVGIAPRQYMEIFNAVERKKDGKIILFDKLNAHPRYSGYSPSYLLRENDEVDLLREEMVKKKIISREGKTNA